MNNVARNGSARHVAPAATDFRQSPCANDTLEHALSMTVDARRQLAELLGIAILSHDDDAEPRSGSIDRLFERSRALEAIELELRAVVVVDVADTREAAE